MPAATPKREAVRDWRLERVWHSGQTDLKWLARGLVTFIVGGGQGQDRAGIRDSPWCCASQTRSRWARSGAPSRWASWARLRVGTHRRDLDSGGGGVWGGGLAEARISVVRCRLSGLAHSQCWFPYKHGSCRQSSSAAELGATVTFGPMFGVHAVDAVGVALRAALGPAFFHPGPADGRPAGCSGCQALSVQSGFTGTPGDNW